MNYKEALKYLESFQRFGIKLGLGNIKDLLRLLGNPQKSLKVIHIGGTNGKGSVGAFLFYILQEAGYKVGLYTSPHLIDLRERIRINEALITRRDLTRGVEAIARLVAGSFRSISHPTFFEVITALALKYFADKEVDFAILEVGMGGRLDATNVVQPLVSIVTNIDLEHTDRLGKSLKKIAYEKCGIIKTGIPVVTAEHKKEVLRVIETTCRQKKARLYRVGRQLRITPPTLCFPCQRFNYQGLYGDYSNLKISLLGQYQLVNVACALGALELLPQIKITKKAIQKGLTKTRWGGRLEVIRFRIPNSRFGRQGGKLQSILLDGAHNPAAALALQKTIRSYFDYKRLVLLLGILQDKNIPGIVSALVPLASQTVITRSKTHRAADPKKIAKMARKYSSFIVVEEKIPQAIRRIFSSKKRGDLVLVTGSLYLVGAVKAYLQRGSRKDL
jgi:dihydrofolate synthase/folylpolyglutamate synthase